MSDGQRYFAYDDENQLTSVTVSNAWRSEFAYDGVMRRRIRKEFAWSGGAWLKTNEVRYVYDGNLAVQERDGNNIAQVSYTRGDDLSGSLQGAGGIGGLLGRTDNSLLAIGDSGANACYAFDGNGNVTGLLNTNGVLVAKYTYDPFGNLLEKSGPLAEANTLRFSSKEFDSKSALYDYGFRFYDANLQRWLSRDLVAESGGLNLYAILGNDAVDQIDPFGLCDEQKAMEVMEEATEDLNRALEGIDMLHDKLHEGSLNPTELAQVKTDLARLTGSIPSLQEALRQAQQNYRSMVAAAAAAAAARQRALALAGRTGAVAGAGVAGYMAGRAIGRSTPYPGGGTIDENIQETTFEPFWNWWDSCFGSQPRAQWK